MSRCFSYPYLRNGSNVSIKHQSDVTKPVPEQGSSKKERIQGKVCVNEKESKVKYFGEKGPKQVRGTLKRKLVDFKREDDVEKSDISVEHGPPVRVFTRNEDKKGDEAASKISKKNVLRFRLPVKKTKEDGVIDNNVSTSTVSFLPLKCKEPDVTASETQPANVLLPRPDSVVGKDQPCSSELQRDSFSGNAGPSSENLSDKSKKHKSKKHKKELKYEALFRHWVPSSLDLQMDDDNADWLFAAQKQGRNDSGSVEIRSSDNIVTNSTAWPTARFLPEADIYALPYTIPF